MQEPFDFSTDPTQNQEREQMIIPKGKPSMTLPQTESWLGRYILNVFQDKIGEHVRYESTLSLLFNKTESPSRYLARIEVIRSYDDGRQTEERVALTLSDIHNILRGIEDLHRKWPELVKEESSNESASV